MVQVTVYSSTSSIARCMAKSSVRLEAIDRDGRC
jgi:hypothetical protein